MAGEGLNSPNSMLTRTGLAEGWQPQAAFNFAFCETKLVYNGDGKSREAAEDCRQDLQYSRHHGPTSNRLVARTS